MKKAVSLVLALALVLGSTAAFAAVWPNGTPTVYVGYGAGGGTDTSVRPVVAEMAKYLGETINVVNMPGANSSVAAEYVLAQPHDGYSLFATGTGGFSSFPVYAYSDSSWQDWISFHPFSGPAVVYANPDSGITTTEQLFDYIAAGNKFGVGAFGNGPHTQFEAIAAAKGVASPNYALFGSCNEAGVGCIAGDAMVGASSLSAVIDFINAGRLVPIFVTSATPFEFTGVGITAPSVTTEVPGTESIPSLNETWPVMIPRDAPQEIVDKLTEAFNYAITTDAIKDFAASKGFNIIGLTGEEADKFLAYSISGYAWTIFNAGLAEGNPADHGIPTLAEFDWEALKDTLK
ncbi:MAG TPA: tripartite tricarboxylate transporter substrate-binding protein [Candidatus Limnocylindria bacterium]|nr:tripartite tricarboxylate transporter substrate-binding protein [Candidatus Limnocylindria bacterium]